MLFRSLLDKFGYAVPVTVEVPGQDLAALERLLQEKSQILLVDDSEMNRVMLSEILGQEYRILEAKDGQECMEKLQEEAGDIALVLLDINMPGMDGFEVLRAMNANSFSASSIINRSPVCRFMARPARSILSMHAERLMCRSPQRTMKCFSLTERDIIPEIVS